MVRGVRLGGEKVNGKRKKKRASLSFLGVLRAFFFFFFFFGCVRRRRLCVCICNTLEECVPFCTCKTGRGNPRSLILFLSLCS